MRTIYVYVNYAKKDTVLTFSDPGRIIHGYDANGRRWVERFGVGRIAKKLLKDGYKLVGQVTGFDIGGAGSTKMYK